MMIKIFLELKQDQQPDRQNYAAPTTAWISVEILRMGPSQGPLHLCICARGPKLINQGKNFVTDVTLWIFTKILPLLNESFCYLIFSYMSAQSSVSSDVWHFNFCISISFFA